MKIEVDVHTHTVLCGHAFSTISENAHYAKKAGLKGFVLTEHGPKIPKGAPEYIINIFGIIPEKIENVRIYRGAEANILDFNGIIDISEINQSKLDFLIASLHDDVIQPGSISQNTEAMIRALNNPRVDSIGHPDNPYFEIDYDGLVKEAKHTDKILEINNHSFLYRKGSHKNCIKILNLCKKNDVRISVGSDAHICFAIGLFDFALKEIKESGFPKELIINRTRKSFENYLNERKTRLT